MSKEYRRAPGQDSKPKDGAGNQTLKELQSRWRMAGLPEEDIASQSARFLQGEAQRAADPLRQTSQEPIDPLKGLELSRGVRQFVEKAQARGDGDVLQIRLDTAAGIARQGGRKKITMNHLRSTS